MNVFGFIKKFILMVFSFPFFFLGLVFLLSAFHPEAIQQGKSGVRIFFGALLFLGGILFFALSFINLGEKEKRKEEISRFRQEAPGQLNVKPISCPHCGAQVDPSTTFLSPEGTLTMKCPYCGGMFLIEETPKW